MRSWSWIGCTSCLVAVSGNEIVSGPAEIFFWADFFGSEVETGASEEEGRVGWGCVVEVC